MLTAAEFHRFADVPPEVEWFANIANRHTRRAYETAVKDFLRFAGIRRPEEFRIVTRADIIAWRDELAQRGLGSTVRHRLASPASLFEYLCNKNAVTHNPVKGVERPKTESGEGKTPAIADHRARNLLEAPQGDDIRDKRDRAILSTLVFHALRREESCKLKVKDFRYVRKGVPHLKVTGKGGKTRYLPLHAGTNGLINDYLRAAGHPLTPARCSGRFATTGLGGSTGRSLPTAFTSSCALTRAGSDLRSVPMRCERRLRPTRSTTRLTTPRCRNGLVMRISRRREFTIIAAPDPRTARLSRSLTDNDEPRNYLASQGGARMQCLCEPARSGPYL
jgi:integrase